MTVRRIFAWTCLLIATLALLGGADLPPALVLIAIGAWALRPWRRRRGPLDDEPF